MRFFLPAATAMALTLAAAISYARSAETSAGDLVVSAWARATPPGAQVAAAYVNVENRGGSADRLLAARSPAANSVSLHATVEENGVATMRPVDDPVIPAGGTLEMRPGGAHLMLTDLQAPLKEGETLSLTLSFETAGELTVEAAVAPVGAAAPADTHHDHAM
ncbi:MAG: copper chaperone PCu(A)C [Rhizobiales bacterium]|jgi:copper(I)-binding protein|nr:copper chaperone PCu(A)C [Hyphomicrobiales bacterium]